MNLDELLFVCRKHRRRILFGFVFGLVLGLLLYAAGRQNRQAVISSSLAVLSKNKDGKYDNNGSSPDYYASLMAEDISDSAAYILSSEDTLKKALKSAGLTESVYQEVQSRLNVTHVKDTQILEITLKWPDSQEGAKILKALNQVAPKVIVKKLNVGSVSVVSQPSETGQTGGISLGMALFFGVAGGLLTVLFEIFRHVLQPTLLSPETVRDDFGRNLICEVPMTKIGTGYYRELIKENSDLFSVEFRQTMVYAASLILKELKARHQNTFIITSSADDEGKTTMAVNIAYELSGFAGRVLLIDMDMHAPGIGPLLYDTPSKAVSLNAVLKGERTMEEAVTHLTPTLDVITTWLGSEPLSPRAALPPVRAISAQYDVVVIDAGAMGMVEDLTVFGGVVEEAVFVMEYGRISQRVIRKNMEDLEKLGIHVLGCIVNKEVIHRWRYDRQFGYSVHGSGQNDIERKKQAQMMEDIASVRRNGTDDKDAGSEGNKDQMPGNQPDRHDDRNARSEEEKDHATGPHTDHPGDGRRGEAVDQMLSKFGFNRKK